MKRNLQLIVIGLLLLLFYKQGRAQQELTLFFSRKIPSVNAVNPSAFKSEQTVLSIPSISFNYGNNAFTFNELFRKEGENTHLNIGNILDQFDDNNIVQTQLSVEILSVQFRIKKYYFTIGMAEKLNAKWSYSDDLIKFAWNGNAQYVGQETEIGPAFDFTMYRELSLGWLREFGKITVGNRLRFLSGRANVTSSKHEAYIYADPQFYQSRVRTDYEVNTSGIEELSDQSLNPFSGTGNPGFAADFGLTWRPAEKWTISSSILDIGSIKWKKDVKRFHSKGEFSFDGLNLNEYFEVDTFNFKEYLDSLKNEFDPDTTNNSYRNNLTPRVYFGVRRKLNDKHEAGVMGYGEFFDGFRPSFILYYGYSPAKKTELGVSYAIKNNLYNHVGISLSQQIKGVQLYLVSDDIINCFIPLDARSINFRFGLNFYFGSGKGSSEKQEIEKDS